MPLSITKSTKPTRGFIKLAALFLFIISFKLNYLLNGIFKVHCAPSNTALVICVIVTNAFVAVDKGKHF